MGTIWPRKSKTGKTRWLARVRKAGGQHTSRTFETKVKAQAWVASIECSINEGRFSHIAEAKKHRMDSIITRYIEHELPKKPKSLKKQKAQLLWWKSKLGNLLLGNISPALIVQYRDELGSGLTNRGKKRSPSTVNRYLAVLSHLFTVATKEWQLLPDSPMKRVSKEKEPRGRDRTLKPDELKRLLRSCKESYSPYLYLFVKIALATAARLNEILTLQWSDINFDQGKAILRETKNGKIRALHLSPGILKMLLKHREKSKSVSELIFPGRIPTKAIDLRYAWEQALNNAQISDFRPHDLRHQAASMMATNGSSDAELREFLGHESVSLVARYVHYRGSAMAHNVNKMNELLQQIEESDDTA